MSGPELSSVIQCYETMFEITSGTLHPEDPEVSYSPSNSSPYGSRWARSMYEQLKSRVSTSGPRNQRKELPVTINGVKIVACHDSCAGGNFMSQELASNLQLDICAEKQKKGSFTLGNGKVVESIGKVMAVCTFTRDPSISATCWFHVFNKLTAPLILGFPFLEDSKTLIMNRHRLQERSSHTSTYPMVNCIDSSQQKGLRFICHIDNRETIMSADTASDLDLMSPSCVKKYKYKLMGGGRSVQLADTSIAQTIGKVLVTLVPADGRSFLKFFDVLPGLSSDMLLGEATLESIEAFTRLKDSFVNLPAATENPEFNILLDLGVVNKAIARYLRRPFGTTQCPKTRMSMYFIKH